MTSLPILQPGVRVTDANGNPVSGAKLKFFAAGTTTPLSVYSDADGLTTLGTTVYTDDGGYPVVSSGSSTKTLVYSTAEELKVVITDATDTTIATHDNVTSSIPTPSAITTALPTTPVSSKTSDYVVVVGDRGKLLNVNPSGGSVTITLPSAVTVGDNFRIGVRNNASAASTNIVAVSSTGTQLIAQPAATGANGLVLRTIGETIWLVSDGANWNVDASVPGLVMGEVPRVRVESRRTAAPSSVTLGSRYIINDTPTGSWLSFDFVENDIVEYVGINSWLKLPIRDGYQAWVADEDMYTTYYSSEWHDWSNVEAPPYTTMATAKFVNRSADGTGGGTATSGSWLTVPLGTKVTQTNEIASVALASNQFTIPLGIYRVIARQPFFGTRVSRIRIRPVTQTSTDDNTRYSDIVAAGDASAVCSATAIIDDVINVDASSEVFILEYYVGTTRADGLGTPHGESGRTEDYASVVVMDIQSVRGPQGVIGPQGADGLDASYAYVWSTSVSGDPGSGKISGNNATIASITQIMVSETDAYGGALASVLASWDNSTSSTSKGRIRISKEGSTANFHEFHITGDGTDLGSYWSFPVSYVGTSGAIANGVYCAVNVMQTGDVGDPGTTVPDPAGLTALSSPDWAADYVVAYDTDVGATKKLPLSEFNIVSTATTFGIKVDGIIPFTYGALGPNTFGFYPDGTNLRFGLSDTSLQLHYDNIVLGVGNGASHPPNVTWKLPDHNATNSGYDHALFSITAAENSGTFTYSVVLDAFRAGGVAQNAMNILLASLDAAKTTTLPRIYVKGGVDPVAIGIGTTAPTSVTVGAVVHVHATDGSQSSFVHFTNSASGAAAADGVHIGLDASEDLALVNGGARDAYMSLGGTTVVRIKPSGLIALGAEFTPSYRLSMYGETAHTVGIERRTTDASGQDLTVRAGGAYSGGSNKSGGSLLLMSGTSTGNAASAVKFSVPAAGASGSADNSHAVVGLITAAGLGVGGDFTPTYAYSIYGANAATIGMERRPTDAAGQNLTVLAGGAYSGGSNRAGGSLVLSSGASTGNTSSTILFQAPTAGASGTTANAPATIATISTTGMGFGVTPSCEFHAKKASAGSGIVKMSLDYNNTTSGETHTGTFLTQDDGAGTIRALFTAPGPLNGGTADQGSFQVLVENGSAFIVSFSSFASDAASRMYMYDRSGGVRIINMAHASSPYVNLVAAGGEYRVNSTKVVGARETGYSAFTGANNKAATYATGTVTLVQLAERVAAMQASMTTHGLIGA